jgi:hypothetical protein
MVEDHKVPAWEHCWLRAHRRFRLRKRDNSTGDFPLRIDDAAILWRQFGLWY